MSNPTFQHRHYAAIAAILAEVREENETLYGGGSLREDVMDRLQARMVREFKRDNSKFDQNRFDRAARRAPDMHGKDKR